ncbi:hypothetical protein [Occultella gossypii]|uniref:Uncharacterized protein n=1 Tax=Occultella gossypii TaxID=2800820 RepID=A0ABS7SD15_9MICO|nr:hypothetical protein [Occultella gossypii]MBZ2198259.1 hypothetical protein [Occultella gossypii]
MLAYLLAVLPYARLRDRDSVRAHGGWTKFLLINYVVGFLITMLMIWHTLTT